MTLNAADRIFQQDMVRSMATAYALGLLEEDDDQVQKWVRRCDSLVTVAMNAYGPVVARALLDQAMAEGMVLGPDMLTKLAALLPPSEDDQAGPRKNGELEWI